MPDYRLHAEHDGTSRDTQFWAENDLEAVGYATGRVLNLAYSHEVWAKGRIELFNAHGAPVLLKGEPVVMEGKGAS